MFVALVNVKMPQFSLRFCVCICNFLSISCMELDDRKWKTSKLRACSNIVKTFLVFLGTIFVWNDKFIRNEIFSEDLLSLKNYSSFSKIIVNVIIYLEPLAMLSVCLVNFFGFSNFTNRLLKLFFGLKCPEKFHKRIYKCILNSLIIGVIILICQFIALVNFSLVSWLAFAFLSYSYLVLLGSMTLIKSFEIIFSTLLEDFRLDLKLTRCDKIFKPEKFRSLIRKYKNIQELNEAFNKLFGLQMTIITCSLISMKTFEVI